jgi:hypothetical protein
LIEPIKKCSEGRTIDLRIAVRITQQEGIWHRSDNPDQKSRRKNSLLAAIA